MSTSSELNGECLPWKRLSVTEKLQDPTFRPARPPKHGPPEPDAHPHGEQFILYFQPNSCLHVFPASPALARTRFYTAHALSFSVPLKPLIHIFEALRSLSVNCSNGSVVFCRADDVPSLTLLFPPTRGHLDGSVVILSK